MKRYQQFQPLVISHFETNLWEHPVHEHNHYELIYIEKGTGIHNINENCISYQTGDWFLIGPDEAHYFAIAQLTSFVFLKFTDPYSYAGLGDLSQFRHLEYLIKSRETH